MHNIVFELSHTDEEMEDIKFLSSDEITIDKVLKPKEFKPLYLDTILFDEFKRLYLPHRKLIFHTKHKDSFYRISIHKSLIDTNLLVEHVALGITLMTLLFILSLYFLNRYFFREIWSGFFVSLDKIQNYDLSSAKDLEFSDSMIIEFTQLNDAIKKMTHRIKQDFIGLKEFTGNISHELQTPLAIIKSKVELILQSEGLKEKQIELISDIYNGTTRLSKLNQALILLTKIEHHQFLEKTNVSIGDRIDFHVSNFEEMLEALEIKYTKKVLNKVDVLINPELADILTINLLKNAVDHNVNGGRIDVVLSKKQLKISNKGKEIHFNASKIFNRFKKEPTSKKSLGLGLAIVRKICDYYNFDIKYSCENNIHCFEIKFV